MVDIVENAESFPPVPLLAMGDKALGGGEQAPANKQAVALAKRTANVKKNLDDLIGVSIHLIGKLGGQDELEAINTDGLLKWTGYIVNGVLTVWDGAEWVGINALVSEAPGNALSLGEDGKLYVSNDINADIVQSYNAAKE